jgi:hypothetical protein
MYLAPTTRAGATGNQTTNCIRCRQPPPIPGMQRGSHPRYASFEAAGEMYLALRQRAGRRGTRRLIAFEAGSHHRFRVGSVAHIPGQRHSRLRREYRPYDKGGRCADRPAARGNEPPIRQEVAADAGSRSHSPTPCPRRADGGRTQRSAPTTNFCPTRNSVSTNAQRHS